MDQPAHDIWSAKIWAIDALQYWYKGGGVLLSQESVVSEIYSVFGSDIPKNNFGVKVKHPNMVDSKNDLRESSIVEICIQFPDGFSSFMRITYKCNKGQINIEFQDNEFQINVSKSISCRCFSTFISSIKKFYREFPTNKEVIRTAQKLIDEQEREAQKRHRLLNIAKVSIKGTVSQIMKNTEYKWKLEDAYDEGYLLCVKAKGCQVLKILLDINSFKEKLSTLISAIEKTLMMIENMPFAIEVRKEKW